MAAFDEETTSDPHYADQRNFYKVEKWSRDGMRIVELLYAGSSLSRAQALFAATVKHRPRIRLTIRQRTRVLQEWPSRKDPTTPLTHLKILSPPSVYPDLRPKITKIWL